MWPGSLYVFVSSADEDVFKGQARSFLLADLVPEGEKKILHSVTFVEIFLNRSKASTFPNRFGALSSRGMRTAVLIAAHYPPTAMAVGAQRTIHLALALTQQGWRPIVLTIAPRPMEMVDEAMLGSSLPHHIEPNPTFCFHSPKASPFRARSLDPLSLPHPLG